MNFKLHQAIHFISNVNKTHASEHFGSHFPFAVVVFFPLIAAFYVGIFGIIQIEISNSK